MEEMNFIQWISQTGTDEWIAGLITNNKAIFGAAAVVVGALFKGKGKNFIDNLKTAIPLVGESRKLM